MNVFEIPGMLFEELSKQFGEGGVKKVRSRDTLYKVVELKSDLGGALGFRGRNSERDRSTVFVVWDRVPRGEDNIFEPEPVVEIKAASVSTGEWAYGQGDRMADRLRASFPLCGFSLNNAAMVVVSSAIARASELVRSPECEKVTFWQAERQPDLDYTEPSGYGW